MVQRFNHKSIQERWSPLWEQANVCGAKDFSEKPKKYILVEFPYPSGTGLHMGHFIRFTLPDIYARKLRMQGYNVLFPIGWDAFGLPAENYAVETGVHPRITTERAIENFRTSLRHAGFGVDWDRVVDTTEPDYYKWTQWLFLKFWENNLAYIAEEPVWWCEKLRTVLANEEVLEDEKGNKISERGGHPVEKRPLKQWILKITEYAEKLLAGLDTIDFPEHVKQAQRNWIGKSKGARLTFDIKGKNQSQPLEVFTTRPDTIFGVTFMVLAPEHPLIDALADQIENLAEVEAYRKNSKNLSDVDRERSAAKAKTGIRLLGLSVEHPLISGKMLPVFIADYVLMGYGTGAIMAVPAHDERDYEFAQKYSLEVVQTVFPREGDSELPYTGPGVIRLNDLARGSLQHNGMTSAKEHQSEEFKELVLHALAKTKRGKQETTYRLRDWVFSRQRYWGEPIPMIHREDGTVEAIAVTSDPASVAAKLPLLLPEVPDYTPSADGASPLERNKEWVQTEDSQGHTALRETNTMPNWAGSCWYYLRYLDPRNESAFADQKKLSYWLPVDVYFGGSEHTTLHLLYSRFWHQFLFDLGLVPTPEPYQRRINGGILLGEDGFKQSKSRGNGVDLNEMLDKYGADALRLYICFLGPYEATIPWNTGGLKACRKVVETINELSDRVVASQNHVDSEQLQRAFHKAVKHITSMVDDLKGNTAVSAIMIFINEAKKAEQISAELWSGFLRLIAPFTVFLAEDLWQKLGEYSKWSAENSIHSQSWPTFDPALAEDELVTVGVQINGKMRGTVSVSAEMNEEDVRQLVFGDEQLAARVGTAPITKFLYVPKKIVSIVVQEIS
jgi:leucyl-tRNA synthetase